MRFFPDRLDIETPVRWFFCEDGADALPYPTVFSSRNWLDKQTDFRPALGEVEGAPRPWADGMGPPVAMTGKPCGPQSAWSDGIPGDPALPLDTDVWGIPRCCFTGFFGECPILPGLDFTRADILFGLATAVFAVQVSDAANINAIGLQLTSIATATARGVHVNPDLPNWAAWWDSRQVLVVIEGTRHEAALLRQILASVLDPVEIGGFATSSYWRNTAIAIADELSAAGIPTNVPILFVGHSLGGSIATILLARERQLRPGRVAEAVTFGEPKTGDARLAALIADRHTRVETIGDVVPFVPPNFGVFAWLDVFAPLPLLRRWAIYRRPSHGWRVYGNGLIAQAFPEDAGYLALSTLVAEILAGHDPFLVVDHAIATYAHRLLLGSDSVAPYLPPRCYDLLQVAITLANLDALSPPAVPVIQTAGGGKVRGGALYFLIVKYVMAPIGGAMGGGTAALRAVGRLIPAGGGFVSGGAIFSHAARIDVSGGGFGGGGTTLATAFRIFAAGGAAGRGAAEWGSTGYVEFTDSDAVWRRPPGVSFVTVGCHGGGAAGVGTHGNPFSSAGGGGGGGAYATAGLLLDTSRINFDIHVSPAAAENESGSDAWFDDGASCLAKGGGLGEGGNTPINLGGVGGQSADCIGDTVFSGGAGGLGVFSDGGGGGGGAGDAADGGDGAGTARGTGGSAAGGDGGDGGSGDGSTGSGGNDWGGAGGAGGYIGFGGVGGRGMVSITW